jgi:hypothetical protein
MLLILEDNSERVKRFTEAAKSLESTHPLKVWGNAKVMIRELESYLYEAKLISLDHDLESDEGGDDPGDGLEVVKFLVSQPIRCPVIIHSSNVERSSWMAREFELAGWPFWRLAPLGNDWIEVYWRVLATKILRKANRIR